jgi:hypothetical protein
MILPVCRDRDALTRRQPGKPAAVFWLLTGVCLVGAVAALATGAPRILAERIVTVGERSVRVTLFDNRMAVTTVREDGEQVFFRHMELEQETFVAYLGAINRDAQAILDAKYERALDGEEPHGVVYMWVENRGVVRVRYPRSALLDLPMARLSSALDDLEQHVSAASPSLEELRDWEPRRGDVVELISGGRARVLEVREENILVLEYEDVAVIQMVPAESSADLIRRVIERGP